MSDGSEPLENPDEIHNANDERRDGRPTGGGEGAAESAGVPHEDAPTVAPEEEGGSPTTEHAPGGDL
jgi:hypothetical protein